MGAKKDQIGEAALVGFFRATVNLFELPVEAQIAAQRVACGPFQNNVAAVAANLDMNRFLGGSARVAGSQRGAVSRIF